MRHPKGSSLNVPIAAQFTARSNAFVESLFRTVKYRPEFPDKGFADLSERAWTRRTNNRWPHDRGDNCLDARRSAAR
ncbi:MAG: hypothetical protein MUF20_13250 [Methylotetracoccus sp.]|jgi:hypothetical protein|nr:hypothetical protein [Methylotetracoccus sp.]